MRITNTHLKKHGITQRYYLDNYGPIGLNKQSQKDKLGIKMAEIRAIKKWSRPQSEAERKATSKRMIKNNPMKNKGVAIRQGATLRNRFLSGGLKSYTRTQWHKDSLSILRKTNNPMKDPEVSKRNAENHFKKWSLGERRFFKFCYQKAIPFEYVGNNKLAVGDKNSRYRFPDFVNWKKKKLVEIYHTTFKYSGVGFRGREWIDKTINHYKKFGYHCLTINEKDLKDFDLLEKKIRAFLVD